MNCTTSTCCERINGGVTFLDGFQCLCYFPRHTDCSGALDSSNDYGPYAVTIAIQVVFVLLFAVMFVFLLAVIYVRARRGVLSLSVANSTLMYCSIAIVGAFMDRLILSHTTQKRFRRRNFVLRVSSV